MERGHKEVREHEQSPECPAPFDSFFDSLKVCPFGNPSYFKSFSEKLFQTADYKPILEKIKSIPFPKGICGYTFKSSDVAWHCLTCRKDENCIMCQACFEKSNHQGHPVHLDRNISGCCDCGDADAWDPRGACPMHPGFIGEDEAKIELLPKELGKRLVRAVEILVWRYHILCNIMLWKKPMPEDKALEGHFLEMFNILACLRKLSECTPIFLFVVCRSLSGIPNEKLGAKLDFGKLVSDESAKEAIQKTNTSTITAMMLVHDVLPQKLRKHAIGFLMYHLKSKNFKMQLAECYIQNLMHVSEKGKIEAEQISELGVQILGVDEIAVKIFSKEEYLKIILECMDKGFDYVMNKGIKGSFIVRVFFDIKYAVQWS